MCDDTCKVEQIIWCFRLQLQKEWQLYYVKLYKEHRAKASQLKWNTFLYSRGRCRHAHRNVVLFVFVDCLIYSLSYHWLFQVILQLEQMYSFCENIADTHSYKTCLIQLWQERSCVFRCDLALALSCMFKLPWDSRAPGLDPWKVLLGFPHLHLSAYCPSEQWLQTNSVHRNRWNGVN